MAHPIPLLDHLVRVRLSVDHVDLAVGISYASQVLAAVGGNKSQAAKVLGVGRKTLYRRPDAWGVDTTD